MRYFLLQFTRQCQDCCLTTAGIPLISFYKIYRKIICAKSAKHGFHTFQSRPLSGFCHIGFQIPVPVISGFISFVTG
mgnify:CR=1 FL=1